MAPCKTSCTAASLFGSAVAASVWLPCAAAASSSEADETCSSTHQCARSISKENMLLQMNHQAPGQLSLLSTSEREATFECRAAAGAKDLDASVTNEGCAVACATIPQGTWPCEESLCTCEVIPAPTTTVPPSSTSGPTGSTSWDGDHMKMTHYWDCSGQGCDAPTLQPWDVDKYVSPPGYGPQDPEMHGGALYGEKMWLTGAASDALSALMGDDDGCCGGDPNDGGVGGCGKCALVQNPDSLHPDWTAVVMKKNRCPPHATGCGANEPHFDIAAPGFDNLQWSLSNICGLKPGTGFDSQAQSEAVGSWWTQCSNTADCAHLCDKLPADFRDGCKLFASWGWKRGDPKSVKFKAVPCPSAFKEHVSKQFGPDGVTA